MKKLNLYYIVISILLVLFSSAAGSGWDNARSIGMAGSYTAVARGYDAIAFNPANLALSDSRGTALQIFGIGTMINNNSFSKGDYNKYNGLYLSESDKNDILAKIPEGGLEFKGNSAASMLSFSSGPFAVSATVEAGGRGNLSKDVVELAFFGNNIGETITIDDADAEGIAHVDINFAYGRKVKNYRWGELTAGVNLKYIRGLAYFKVSDAVANATTNADGIDSDGSVSIKSSTGGSGFGLDVGAAATYKENWVFSAGIKNLLSSINWSKDTKETEYFYDMTSFTVETADDDSTVISDDVEREISSFSASLAPQINLGAKHEIGKFLLASDLKLGLAKKAGVTTTPELSFGAEYSYLAFLPVRAGLSFGGLHGSSLGLGGGIRLSSFFVDIAWASSGTILPSFGRGLSLAVSSGLRF